MLVFVKNQHELSFIFCIGRFSKVVKILRDSVSTQYQWVIEHLGVNAKEAVKGPSSVEYGMKWLQSRTIVIDKRRTPHAYEEFVNYEFEKNRQDEWISGYPDNKNNHTIDATRYALERVANKFKKSCIAHQGDDRLLKRQPTVKKELRQ